MKIQKIKKDIDGLSRILRVISLWRTEMPLFHYTDVYAVKSILTNKKIRLTDIRFMNDSKELHDGIEILSGVLKILDVREFLDEDFLNEAIEYIRKSLTDTVSYGISEDPLYIFSLGKAENRLSQWRSYGTYAIEFDENKLKECLGLLHTCNYEMPIKNELSIKALIFSIKEICGDMEKNNGCIGMSSLNAIINLIETSASFKDGGFFEEQEVRVIARRDDETIMYHPKGNMLIPCLEMEITLDSVNKIHVGPMQNQELAYESMCSFAQYYEKEWQHDSNNTEYWLQVEKSDIPYRE